MNLKVVVGALIAGGALAFFLSREATGPADAAVDRTAAGTRVAPNASARGVEGLAPGTGTVRPASVITPPAVAPRATLSNELAASRQLKSLYDRLVNSDEGRTPEGQLTLYRILRACANVTDRRGPRPLRVPTEEEKQSYLASLNDRDPAKAKRIAAYERLGEDRCVGLTGIITTEAELGAKLREAVAAGSPGAKVLQVEREMWIERRTSEVRGMTLSDAQIESLRSAMGAKDPEAMIAAARLFEYPFRDLTVRIGPDQLNVESRALRNAIAITACDYGASCGDNNMRILTACANQGHCEAGNLPDFIQYYHATPHDAELVQQYRMALRTAIDTGDWSVMTFNRGPVGPTAQRPVAAPGRPGGR